MYRPRNKAPLQSLTKLEQERELKLRREEEEEKISILGQESDRKAKRWVQKEVEEQEKKTREYFEDILELLKRHRQKKIAYFRILTQVLLHFLKEEWIPKNYFVEVEANDLGIKVELKGTDYYGGFKVCGLPSYDFRACEILAAKLGNTVGKLEGYSRKSDEGIALPDREDLRVYG